MSKHDEFRNADPNLTDDIKTDDQFYFDYDAFEDLFQNNDSSEYEFDDNYSEYIPPKDGLTLPSVANDPEPEPEPEITPEPISTPNVDGVFSDSGIYSSVDGVSEFRTFDGFVPGVAEGEWIHQEPEPVEDLRPFDDTSEEDVEDEYEDEDEDEDEDAPKSRRKGKKSRKREHRGLKIFSHIILGFVTFMALMYLVMVYSDNSVIVKLRNTYIQTAMSTLSHKWLATAIFPPDMIHDLMVMKYESENAMIGIETNWGAMETQELPAFENAITELMGSQQEDELPQQETADPEEEDPEEIKYGSPEEQAFFEYFYQIEYHSMMDYLDKHPEALENGWYYLNINEAGLDEEGTSIKTIYGDQVLAINVAKGLVLVRLNIDYSRGVLAICKDTSQLRLCPASTIGTIGQTVGRICDANGGLLGMTGNGFVDQDGNGNGGEISGVGVCSGRVYGEPIWGYKRAEIRNDNRMYIVDSTTSVSSEVRDACEFTPALIVDGKIIVDDNCGWTGPNPRTAIGQTAYLESILVVIEGRFADSPGCSVVSVAERMKDYGCVQAMNNDGGTSALMYYDGEVISRCSNTATPNGRPMPTAWIYG